MAFSTAMGNDHRYESEENYIAKGVMYAGIGLLLWGLGTGGGNLARGIAEAYNTERQAIRLELNEDAADVEKRRIQEVSGLGHNKNLTPADLTDLLQPHQLFNQCVEKK